MGAAIALRVDFDGATLRRLARKTKNANQSRRLLALAEIYDGCSRSDASLTSGSGSVFVIRSMIDVFGRPFFTLDLG